MHTSQPLIIILIMFVSLDNLLISDHVGDLLAIAGFLNKYLNSFFKSF